VAGLFHELEEARGSEAVEDEEIADVMDHYARCGGGVWCRVQGAGGMVQDAGGRVQGLGCL